MGAREITPWRFFFSAFHVARRSFRLTIGTNESSVRRKTPGHENAPRRAADNDSRQSRRTSVGTVASRCRRGAGCPCLRRLSELIGHGIGVEHSSRDLVGSESVLARGIELLDQRHRLLERRGVCRENRIERCTPRDGQRTTRPAVTSLALLLLPRVRVDPLPVAVDRHLRDARAPDALDLDVGAFLELLEADAVEPLLDDEIPPLSVPLEIGDPLAFVLLGLEVRLEPHRDAPELPQVGEIERLPLVHAAHLPVVAHPLPRLKVARSCTRARACAWRRAYTSC